MSFPAIVSLVATLVGLGAAAAAVWLVFSAFADAERTRESAGWQAVDGTITASRVESFRTDGIGRTYIPSIAYDYQMEGRALTGHEVRIGGMITSLEIAEQIVRDYPVGARVPVFVDSVDASRAVLHPALPGTFLMRPFFAVAAGVILFTAIFFALIAVPSASAAPGLTLVVPLGLIAAAIYCVAGGVVIIVRYARKRGRDDAATWRKAPGVITESAVVAAPSVEGGAFAVLRIAFRYAVDGEHCIGRRVSQGPALMTRADADAVAARYPVGAAVDVFHHPDAASAVLDPSPAPSFLAYAAACGVGLITIGAVAAVAPLIFLGVRLSAAH